ncbi:uncharacterized protein V6R79_009740 [Siganus canaliculatus]
MALRRCLRFTGVAPRLFWNTTFLPVSSVPGGRRCVSTLDTNHWFRTTQLLLRRFSSTPQSTEVSYDQLKQILAGRKSVVVDVREPWERREYGFIPGSINVPLGQVNTAFQLTPEEFKEKYGSDMPQHTDSIVFSCLAGVRSKAALDKATSLGYKE